MQLNVRDVARLFQVPEQTIYHWIRDENLPALKLNEQFHFNRSELLEWATQHKRTFDPGAFGQANGGQTTLDQAMRAGGVLTCVPGNSKEAILQFVVATMPLPADLDRQLLFQVLLSRESEGSTEVGRGVAIPHPRYPVIAPVDGPRITTCFLETPVSYSRKPFAPVHTLFVMVCPTVRMHLQLLAQLARALQDEAFLETIQNRRPAEAIYEQASRFGAGAMNPIRA